MNPKNKSIAEWLKDLPEDEERDALETLFRLVPQVDWQKRLNIRCSSMYQALTNMFLWKLSGDEEKWTAIAARYINNSK